MDKSDSRAAQHAVDEQKIAGPTPPSTRVVVAEPDLERRLTYSAVLRKAGYAVTDVGDAAALLAEIAHAGPDLIIFRLNEPYTDGFDLCRAVRSDADTRDIPVIVLTKNDDAYVREQVVRAGATSILSEPLKATLLLRQVRRLLARSKPRICGLATRPRVEHPGEGALASFAR